ncbi:ThiF family adenylyltransferase [Segatella paludivivens]|uniref:ThiF family adenylyltransferase n=1 Tax=Segatella paludivivens TaxID=185294 RepID=UPI000368D444|nr:ThiF family adenylyltransferase [Segatella paludivivens]
MAESNDFIQFIKCTSAEIPPCVFNDVKRIASMPDVTFDQTFYKYNNSHVIKLALKLELPTRYNKFIGLVKEEEPVFIVFSENYPDSVPCACIGRNDFDFEHTPHIYCNKDGLRPICLFRGNGDEWFANMELEDYIKHLRAWYEDLATVNNILNGGEFEPLRLEGYRATLIYDYDQLSANVDSLFGKQENHNMFFLYFKNKIIINLTNNNLWILKCNFIDINKDFLPGAIYWSQSSVSNDDYDVNLPDTYGGLITYANKYGINLNVSIDSIYKLNNNQSSRFIIILAIRRSKKLIGVNSVFQFVNFEVSFDKDEKGDFVLSNSSKVCFHKQGSPFTKIKAHEISNLDKAIEPSLLIAGCGALGSKVAMHFIRAGITNILFSDPDNLSAFNLSRHALFSNSISCNKADEMKQVADSMYSHETINTEASHKPVKTILQDNKIMEARHTDYILDFTASRIVYNLLVQIESRPSVISSAIYNDGKFGLLLCESEDCLLRIDDIFISFLTQYNVDPFISNYLIKDKQLADEPASLMNVGLGCNSETFILSDDVISQYASAMSITSKRIFEGKYSDGGCWLYKADDEGSLVVKKINIPSFRIYNVDGWSIRISEQVITSIINQAENYGSNETGGYLIGQCNTKNRTIHVIGDIVAPDDTKRGPDNVILGKKGLRKRLSHIERLSGATFGYVGEWHSHPNGPDTFSITDHKEFSKKVLEMKTNNNSKPILEVLLAPNSLQCAVLL